MTDPEPQSKPPLTPSERLANFQASVDRLEAFVNTTHGRDSLDVLWWLLLIVVAYGISLAWKAWM